MNLWYLCDHEWEEKIDSLYHSEFATEVVCYKCQCCGEKDNQTKKIFWPTT